MPGGMPGGGMGTCTESFCSPLGREAGPPFVLRGSSRRRGDSIGLASSRRSVTLISPTLRARDSCGWRARVAAAASSTAESQRSGPRSPLRRHTCGRRIGLYVNSRPLRRIWTSVSVPSSSTGLLQAPRAPRPVVDPDGLYPFETRPDRQTDPPSEARPCGGASGRRLPDGASGRRIQSPGFGLEQGFDPSRQPRRRARGDRTQGYDWLLTSHGDGLSSCGPTYDVHSPTRGASS